MPACLYAYHMCAGSCGGQMVFNPLELELMAIVSCLIGVLGTEPRSYAGTTAPTHGAVSSTPFYQILTIVVWYSSACALYHILLLYAFNHSFNKHRSALCQASAHIRLMSDYCLVLNAGLVSRVSSTSRMNGFLGRGKRWGPPKQPPPTQINRAQTLFLP